VNHPLRQVVRCRHGGQGRLGPDDVEGSIERGSRSRLYLYLPGRGAVPIGAARVKGNPNGFAGNDWVGPHMVPLDLRCAQRAVEQRMHRLSVDPKVGDCAVSSRHADDVEPSAVHGRFGLPLEVPLGVHGLRQEVVLPIGCVELRVDRAPRTGVTRGRTGDDCRHAPGPRPRRRNVRGGVARIPRWRPIFHGR
jgi:hypothetical protein